MDSDSRNTTELLQKLKIDRSAPDASTGLSARAATLLALGGVLLGLAFGYGLAPTEQPALPAQAPQAAQAVGDVAPAVRTPVADTSQAVLNASGYITPRRVATVSAEVMGLINSVDVEEGMSVKEGQVLAQLDDTIARVSAQQAIANVAAAEARLVAAQALLAEAVRGQRRARENTYASDIERTQADTQLATAKANTEAAQSDLIAARHEAQRRQEILNDHTIRAPFSGVVTVKNAQPGEIVAPSSAGGGFTRTGICTIVDMDSLEIEVDVNEAFIGRVSAGQKVEAKLDAYPDWAIPASVIAIIPTADRGKATVRVRIQIDIKDTRILPDMGVKVAFF